MWDLGLGLRIEGLRQFRVLGVGLRDVISKVQGSLGPLQSPPRPECPAAFLEFPGIGGENI